MNFTIESRLNAFRPPHSNILLSLSELNYYLGLGSLGEQRFYKIALDVFEAVVFLSQYKVN